jgi:hypothetical protein
MAMSKTLRSTKADLYQLWSNTIIKCYHYGLACMTKELVQVYVFNDRVNY